MSAPKNPHRPDTPNNDFAHGVSGALMYGVFSPTDGTITYTKFDVEQFSFDSDIDTDDITNTSSYGFQIILGGIQKASGTITFVWDALNNPFVGVRDFTNGKYIPIELLPDGVTVGMQFVAFLNGMSLSSGPKAGTVRVSCKYMSSGPIAWPTANQTTARPPLYVAPTGP